MLFFISNDSNTQNLKYYSALQEIMVNSFTSTAYTNGDRVFICIPRNTVALERIVRGHLLNVQVTNTFTMKVRKPKIRINPEVKNKILEALQKQSADDVFRQAEAETEYSKEDLLKDEEILKATQKRKE